jgi:mannitol/fructose-specific phosphotransferase system IIA component (Ntr-type)
MMLTQILQPGCVRVPLAGKDKDSVIAELIAVADEAGLLGDRQVVE